MVYLYAIILALFSNSAFALVPQVSGYGTAYGGQGFYGSSPESSCGAAVSYYASIGGVVNSSEYSGNYCRVTSGNYVFSWPTLAATYCPDNSSASGSKCSCNEGFKENSEATACVVDAPEDPCELLIQSCAGSEGMTNDFRMSGKKAGVSFTCMPPASVGGELVFPGCSKGCMANVGSFTTAFQDTSGAWVTQGTAKYSGAACEPSVINDLNAEADPEYEKEETPKKSEAPDPSCPNGFKGEVNGVSVCVPPEASSAVTEKEVKDNGDGTKTNTKTEVKCEKEKCEVTKTSTTINNTTNTSIGGSSSTTTVPKKAFCAENKTADVCKNEKGENEDGNGKFGGSCKAGFECKGDAAMCAMAKEQHKRNCETLEEDKDPASFINKIKNGTDEKSAEALQKAAEKINLPTELDLSGSGLPRSCPANPRIDLPFVSKSFAIPFNLICPTLKTMSDVALLITALSLLVWLVHGKKDED